MSERHRPGYLPWDRTGNRLLLQSSLGKTKPSNYEIPNEEFIYGRVTPMDPEHAEKLMYSWKYHQNSVTPMSAKLKILLQPIKKQLQIYCIRLPKTTTLEKHKPSIKRSKKVTKM